MSLNTDVIVRIKAFEAPTLLLEITLELEGLRLEALYRLGFNLIQFDRFFFIVVSLF